MDGKQAVRTKSWTVLGYLVDHGIDAFGIWLTSLSVCWMYLYK